MKDYPCLQGSSSNKRLNKDHLQPRVKGLPGEPALKPSGALLFEAHMVSFRHSLVLLHMLCWLLKP